MRKTLQFIIFLRNLAAGIMAPVLLLALLARGASIGTGSLLIGAYSFTVIAVEFPSGLFADLCGRKASFLLSALLFILSYGLMLLAQSTAALFSAMIASGLGRAFSTGSIDALAIDEAGASGGALVRATARLAVLESAGIAIGALAGGLLSGLGARYAGNLGANLAIYALLFLLTLFCVREQPRARVEGERKGAGRQRGFLMQARESLAFAMQRGVRSLFALSLATGFALISIETYWQPALSSFSPEPWAFGAVSFAGFFCVIVGSRLAERLLTKYPDGGAAILLGSKALFGLCLMLLFFGLRAVPFVAIYMLIYLFLGGGGVAESALLNRRAPADQRASILSLFSFALQIGGLIASLCGYVVSAKLNFRIMWLIAGALLIFCAGALALVAGKRKRRIAPAPADAITNGVASAPETASAPCTAR